MRDWIHVNAANDAGFEGLWTRTGIPEELRETFSAADFPHVKHRKCRESFSHQPLAVGKKRSFGAIGSLGKLQAFRRVEVRFLSRDPLQSAGSE